MSKQLNLFDTAAGSPAPLKKRDKNAYRDFYPYPYPTPAGVLEGLRRHKTAYWPLEPFALSPAESETLRRAVEADGLDYPDPLSPVRIDYLSERFSLADYCRSNRADRAAMSLLAKMFYDFPDERESKKGLYVGPVILWLLEQPRN